MPLKLTAPVLSLTGGLVYTKDFFGTLIKDETKKVFGDRPKKTLALKSKEVAQGISQLLYNSMHSTDCFYH